MRTPPTSVLQNPYFAAGSSTHWIFESQASDWQIRSGSPFYDGYAASFVGGEPAACVNDTKIACEPGGAIKGQCWALAEHGATGRATVRVVFFDSNDRVITYTNGPWLTHNYVWQRLTVYGVAPENVAYALIDFAVYDPTISGLQYDCTGFFGAYVTGSIGRRLVTVKQPLSYYLNLFTSQYKLSSRLNQWQTALMTPIDDLTAIVQQFNVQYDLDNAIGTQLDVLGEIIGIQRQLTFQPSGGASPILGDEDYRLLLYATQAKDTWDGTMASMYQIWQALFPNGLLVITDNQNMTATISLTGNFSSIQQDLINHDYIVPRPEGVLYNPTGPAPGAGLFGFDRNDSAVAGFDTGHFA